MEISLSGKNPLVDKAPTIGSWLVWLTIELFVRVQLALVFFVSPFQLHKLFSKLHETKNCACNWGWASCGWIWHDSLLTDKSSNAFSYENSKI